MNCDGNGRSFTRLYWSGFTEADPVLKLTKKADYALMAMKHLAEHSAEGSRSAKDVADAYGIPPEALAKILKRLAKSGLLQSQHGIVGGYVLDSPAYTLSPVWV